VVACCIDGGHRLSRSIGGLGTLRLAVQRCYGVRHTKSHEGADKPRWAPDGRTIYFVSQQNTSFFNLWGVRFDSARGRPIGEPFSLTHFNAAGLVMSPDGADIDISASRELLTMASVSGYVWMLDNVDK
jgi:dipeptidyl aminopeptidase/acylaminoacyl peptidase